MVDEKKNKQEKVEKENNSAKTNENVEKKDEMKTENKDDKAKQDESKKKKPEVKQEIKPKDKAVVNGKSLHISSKHCFSICKMIKGKTPERAVELLELVVRKKKAVKMYNREVPHRKGNIMSGRFPVNAAKAMIDLVKQLGANSNVNQIDNAIITIAKADKASRPYKKEGRRAKRTHVYLEARDKNKIKSIKTNKKK